MRDRGGDLQALSMGMRKQQRKASQPRGSGGRAERGGPLPLLVQGPSFVGAVGVPVAKAHPTKDSCAAPFGLLDMGSSARCTMEAGRWSSLERQV
ncbi:hypothetical protein GGTG_04363 [Gaeumannomyces tritici R3-111a-1]|uniref:Uncharacterized protein n=1 Tax=Gaeumannomyces tritici (strain R3-111a-1) TaxID=644352 RepID=J3NSW4_GAET3|nr:hypothetical protein GGTG_04363 [Gaeumannomyces tritici R3-111a-1]EJT79277.1 hypothetical protein GGTG_04363 [Gaeumannomyces tritici R3-111a-1]